MNNGDPNWKTEPPLKEPTESYFEDGTIQDEKLKEKIEKVKNRHDHIYIYDEEGTKPLRQNYF